MGIRMIGSAPGDYTGISVGLVGDVNGDKIGDMIIGAQLADPIVGGTVRTSAGVTYIVFGRNLAGGVVPYPSYDLDAFNTPSALGFRIIGAANYDQSGFGAGAAGDVNGDGVGDIIVSSYPATPPAVSGTTRIGAGITYVIFGRKITPGAIFADVDLSLVVGTSSIGFRILGVASSDYSGYSVSRAGDLNGDGVGDIVLGAYGADPYLNSVTRVNAGTVYVIFGRNTTRTGSLISEIELSTMASLNTIGFRVFGASDGDNLGWSVSDVGDVNGDGVDDVLMSAPYAHPPDIGAFARTNAGISYIIYGVKINPGAVFGDIDLATATTTGIPGFAIYGAADSDLSGFSVRGAGDVNGDGRKDFVIGAWGGDAPTLSGGVTRLNAGFTFVIFGRNGGSDIDLATTRTDTKYGLRIYGAAENDNSGRAVSGAGDVNGDGFGDIIIGAPSASPPALNSVARGGAGIAYIIYGRTVPMTGAAFANIDLNTFVPPSTEGYRLLGATAGDKFGFSVGGMGDVNNDGVSDVIIGADEYDISAGNLAGASYVMFGVMPQPTSQPSRQPSSQPTMQPSGQPISRPSAQPSGQPSGRPTGQPVSRPSSQPSGQPSAQPSGQPIARPTSQPSGQPSSRPSAQPSRQPSTQPTLQPSGHPSAQPSRQPSSQPTSQPSGQPTSRPSSQPSMRPSSQPSRQPSTQPSSQPSSTPSAQPSNQPSGQPSAQPSRQPSSQPSGQPSSRPSAQPSSQPIASPSAQPSARPTQQPSGQPSSRPSARPLSSPSAQPTGQPSAQPSRQPSAHPSTQPSGQPSRHPSVQPSVQPSARPTLQPVLDPSALPTGAPSSQPSGVPSGQPSAQPRATPSSQPTSQPSACPTGQPSTLPSTQPSDQPSGRPSGQPTAVPSRQPSSRPSSQPSQRPLGQPTSQPSGRPSEGPTSQPTSAPTSVPSGAPSGLPSVQPSGQPSRQPSARPSSRPSSQPLARPSTQPTGFPSSQPSTQPMAVPSSQPTTQPSGQPSAQPVARPSSQPSVQPTNVPSAQPSQQPRAAPSGQPTAAPSARPTLAPTGEWATVVSQTSQLTKVSYPDGHVWACGKSSQANTTSCVLADVNSGQVVTHYTFIWDNVQSVLSTNAAHNVVINGQSITNTVINSDVATCSTLQDVMYCSVQSFHNTQFLAGSYVSYPNKVVYVGWYNVHTSITILDVASGSVNSNIYTATNMKAFTLSQVQSPPYFVGSFVAGTATRATAAPVPYVVSGMLRTDAGVLSAMILMPVSGDILSSADLVNAMALEYTGPDSFVAGGLQLADVLSKDAYLLRANALYSTIQYCVRYRSLLGGRRALSATGVAAVSQSVVRGMVLVGSTLFMIVDHTSNSNITSLTVLKTSASDGAILKQVHVTAPNTTSLHCTDITSIGVFLSIVCSTHSAHASPQSVMLTVNQALSLAVLPVGFVRSENETFQAESIAFKRSVLRITKSSTVSVISTYNFDTAEQTPSRRPSPVPSYAPSSQPFSAPSGQPSSSPTAAPSVSARPTSQPSSAVPTNTHKPTAKPTKAPTRRPSVVATGRPSCGPTRSPSNLPTLSPSTRPTVKPSVSPTARPTVQPTAKPSILTRKPTAAPTVTASQIVNPSIDRGSSNNNNTPKYVVGVSVGGGLFLLLLGYAYYRHRVNEQNQKEIEARKVEYFAQLAIQAERERLESNEETRRLETEAVKRREAKAERKAQRKADRQAIRRAEKVAQREESRIRIVEGRTRSKVVGRRDEMSDEPLHHYSGDSSDSGDVYGEHGSGSGSDSNSQRGGGGRGGGGVGGAYAIGPLHTPFLAAPLPALLMSELFSSSSGSETYHLSGVDSSKRSSSGDGVYSEQEGSLHSQLHTPLHTHAPFASQSFSQSRSRSHSYHSRSQSLSYVGSQSLSGSWESERELNWNDAERGNEESQSEGAFSGDDRFFEHSGNNELYDDVRGERRSFMSFNSESGDSYESETESW